MSRIVISTSRIAMIERDLPVLKEGIGRGRGIEHDALPARRFSWVHLKHAGDEQGGIVDLGSLFSIA